MNQWNTDLDNTIIRLMGQAQVPGLALALVQGENIVDERVYGVRDAQTQQAITHDTVFQTASLSKPVFGYLVLKLVAAGRLALDTPLSSYWRDASIIDPRLSLITARHALSHTSGFPDWRDGEPLATAWPPGQRFGYSGEGYEYLQRVVEHITGQPLHIAIQAQLLAPLGMHNSTFAWPIDAAGEFVLDDNSDVMPASGPAASSAAFSLLSTAGDYARFLVAMLNPAAQHNAGLSEQEIRMMLTPHIRVGASTALWWALGWGMQRTAWGDAFWHWGGAQNGYMSYAIGFPERRTGIVIMTNSENGLDICEAITWAVLGTQLAQPAFTWLLPFQRWSASPD